ncbi:MAG TPA: peptide chain release factor N(5)-glutamine methyltransferase [Actinobacteria bacterium]|nr:peptide chain release factor N(5)-glutamine methyltransferase [Actinomycetota bacterium]
MHRMPTVGEVLRDAELRLQASEAIEHPHAGKEWWDAEQLLAFVLGHDCDDIAELVPAGALQRFTRVLERRAGGEPPAYITGRVEFAGLDLRIRPGAFIPRESSEFMAEQAVRRLRPRPEPVHLDVATGIGPVALAVASNVPKARVFGVDISAAPVRLARENARLLGLSNATFFHGDLFAPLPATLRRGVDVITVHPPYVGKRELRTLPDEIKRFEPEESLTDGSPQGLGLLGRVAVEGPAWLRSGGWLLVEVSPDRSRAVATVLRHAGYTEVRSTKGGVAVSRVVVGRRTAGGRR